MRKPLVAGNWKMHLDFTKARALLDQVSDGIEAGGKTLAKVEVAVCPPFVYLYPLSRLYSGRPVRFGAQNAFSEPHGAYTGEVAPAMLVDAGATYAILGHSERRHTIGHGEDDWMINRKTKAVMAVGLKPILCVGETLAQRHAGQTMEVLTFQLTAAMTGIEVDREDDLVIAYEPVWAIGTGLTAKPEQAQEAHAHIRKVLRQITPKYADSLRILYGGSVKADNAQQLFSQADVDGGLIGGASLEAEPFLGIVAGALASVS